MLQVQLQERVVKSRNVTIMICVQHAGGAMVMMMMMVMKMMKMIMIVSDRMEKPIFYFLAQGYGIFQ